MAYSHNPYGGNKGAKRGSEEPANSPSSVGSPQSVEPFPTANGNADTASTDPDPRLLAFRQAAENSVTQCNVQSFSGNQSFGGGNFSGVNSPYDSPTASMSGELGYGQNVPVPTAFHAARVALDTTLSPGGTFTSVNDMPLLGTFSGAVPEQGSPARSSSPNYRHNPYGDKNDPSGTFGSDAGLSPPCGANATFCSDMPVLGTFTSECSLMNAAQQAAAAAENFEHQTQPQQQQQQTQSQQHIDPFGSTEGGSGTMQVDPRLLEFRARAQAQIDAIDTNMTLSNTQLPASRESSPFNSFSSPVLPIAPVLPAKVHSPAVSPTHHDGILKLPDPFQSPNEQLVTVYKEPNERLPVRWHSKYLQVIGVKSAGSPSAKNWSNLERVNGMVLTHVNGVSVQNSKDFSAVTAGATTLKLRFVQPSGRPRKKEDAPINQPLRVPPAPPLPPQLTDVAPAIDLPTAVIIQFKYGRKAEFSTSMPPEQIRQHINEYWIVEAAKGIDLGMISGHRPNNDESKSPQYRLVRPAELVEIRTWETDRVANEERALQFIVDKARKLKAPVTVHRTEFQFDMLKLTIHYSSAVAKPDFRQLLHDSFREFKCRIWMNNCQPLPGQPGDTIELHSNVVIPRPGGTQTLV